MTAITMQSLGTLTQNLYAGGPRAVWPVWKQSTMGKVPFRPIPKKEAIRLFHRAREFERQSKQFGCQDGAIGRNGLAVLHAMIFDCLNYASGRLDPSYAALARFAAISVRSVARGLRRLREAGILDWVRRCNKSTDPDGRFSIEQDTNAYSLRAIADWLGFRPRPEAPPPDPETWGRASAGNVVDQAVADSRHGLSLGATVQTLESDAGDGLAAALARLGRAVGAAES